VKNKAGGKILPAAAVWRGGGSYELFIKYALIQDGQNNAC
jgi:hypothetical protein